LHATVPTCTISHFWIIIKLNRSALILTILHSLADCKCKVASLFVGLTQVW